MDDFRIQDIASCYCGAHQAVWSEVGRPVTSKHTFGTHSPVGCFRVGGSYDQCFHLYHEMTGLWPKGIDYWPLYQSVLMKLKDHPDIVQRERAVVYPTPLFTMCHVEKPSPGNGTGVGRVRGGGRVPKPPALKIPPWSPTSERIKPPWIKD